MDSDSYTPEAIRECREILRETAAMYREGRKILEARIADPHFEGDKEHGQEAVNSFRLFESECGTEDTPESIS
jgi:hypothetical protein